MSQGRILFVDDDEDIARVSKRVLESIGYQVTVQSDAEEALRLFRRHPDHFDLIVTDFIMPSLNGLELSSKIFSVRKDIPIVISTGYSKGLLESNDLPEGIAGILQKPATISEVKDAVFSAIGAPASKQSMK